MSTQYDEDDVDAIVHNATEALRIRVAGLEAGIRSLIDEITGSYTGIGDFALRAALRALVGGETPGDTDSEAMPELQPRCFHPMGMGLVCLRPKDHGGRHDLAGEAERARAAFEPGAPEVGDETPGTGTICAPGDEDDFINEKLR